MRLAALFLIAIVALVPAAAQEPASLTILDKTLPDVFLWEPYTFHLKAGGGIQPARWRISEGALPTGFSLNPNGELIGNVEESVRSEFTVLATDNNRPPIQARKDFILRTARPLSADWNRNAKVNGQRIDGSIKVSNRTGRDFDLTMIVLAIDDLNRATAIGYQHFPLKRDTRDMELPFGENLSRGNYTVNVDVVGEEGISGRIFRARLMTGKLAVTQGP